MVVAGKDQQGKSTYYVYLIVVSKKYHRKKLTNASQEYSSFFTHKMYTVS
jgi:hypothetical protein